MPTFLISPAAILSLSTLAAITMQDKKERELSPVLTMIRLTVTRERWTACATDRHVVVEVAGVVDQYDGDQDPITVLISDKDALAMAKLVRANRSDGAPVQVEISEGGTALSILQLGESAEFATHDLNFPPVERLFPKDPLATVSSAGQSFRADSLIKLEKVVPASVYHRLGVPKWWAATSLNLDFFPSAASSRPGPTLVTRGWIDLTEFRALIQPLLKRQ